MEESTWRAAVDIAHEDAKRRGLEVRGMVEARHLIITTPVPFVPIDPDAVRIGAHWVGNIVGDDPEYFSVRAKVGDALAVSSLLTPTACGVQRRGAFAIEGQIAGTVPRKKQGRPPAANWQSIEAHLYSELSKGNIEPSTNKESPDQVMRWMFGASKLGSGRMNAKLPSQLPPKTSGNSQSSSPCRSPQKEVATKLSTPK